jgi:hypothetical protein
VNARDNDETIRTLLSELRDADAANAPALSAVIKRRPAATVFDAHRALGMLAAAGIVIATSVAVREGMKPRLVVPQEVVALSSWRPMTDALLERLPDVITDAPLTASLLPMPRPDNTMERTP